MKILEALVDRYYQVQKHRIAVDAQIREMEKAGEDATLLRDFSQKFLAIEKDLAKTIKKEVEAHPMWKWMKEVKGVGPIIAAGLISTIDIHATKHASSLWKYAGLTPDSKRVKGVKLDYNPFLKDLCWKLGESFVKAGGFYRQVYDTQKERYQRKFPEKVSSGKKNKDGKPVYKYSKGHIHNMARRKAVNRFLADMWVEWRTQEGLPVSEPFHHRQ